ncbi:hypothetical protein KY348_03710 [Candidatus Woesearchaeota archaeon]|nr:hypothetical protein [Candidatus Woesearchaeota archaeon]
MRIKNFVAMSIAILLCIISVYAFDCDCHPGTGENRVCLYIDPAGTIPLSGDTFEFDIVVRNYFSWNIETITTEVESCQGPGGSCTTSGTNSDFQVTINPTTINDIGWDQSISYSQLQNSDCSMSNCRNCGEGVTASTNSKVKIVNAPDGSYTIQYKVTWVPVKSPYIGGLDDPSPKSRYIDVNIDFSSNGGCIPDCVGKECGGDGCGGSCGSCSGGETCQNGQCVSTCTPDCVGKECGGDGCGGSCGSCSGGETCQNGQCVSTCTPDCVGKECGGDGCGGSCGTCSGGYNCVNGVCVSTCSDECSPSGSRECSGNSYRICGNYDGDSCLEWGSLTACSGGESCVSGVCVCQSDCSGKVCGPDGCGGSCGVCGGSLYCDTGSGLCVECLNAGHCDDGNVCTTDSCSSGVCVNSPVSAGVSCSGCGGAICECHGGFCVNAGCTSDSDCSDGFVCNVGSGLCVECLVVGDCDDGEECTSDSCVSNFCSHAKLGDGSSCAGDSGSCCSGVCVTSIENDGFSDDCRGGPLCVAGVLRYYYDNNGELCGDFQCRECLNGFCNVDDNSRCGYGSGDVCVAGTCSSSGCSSDSECSATPSTPYCDTGSGLCVECLQASQCDDGNECTSGVCVSGSCSFSSLPTGSSCTTCGDSSCGCVLGVCANLGSGCTGDSDCVSGTYCNIGSGLCVECVSSVHCDDGNVCTSGSCISGSCVFGSVADGFVCSGCGDSSCVCSSGVCVSGACVPDCSGKVCGGDGCGGSCGTCLAGESCVSGVCVAGCTPDCSGKVCGVDGCGGSCGACADGKVCNGGVCVVPGSCVPDWSCSDWTGCRVDGTRVRFCFDKKGCGSVVGKPAVSEGCVYGEDAGVDTDVGGGVDTDVGDGAGNVSEEEPEEVEEIVEKGFPWITLFLILSIVGVILLVYIMRRGSSSQASKKRSYGKGMDDKERTASDYIKMNLDRGYSPEQVRQTLMNAGWSSDELDKLFKRFK